MATDYNGYSDVDAEAPYVDPADGHVDYPHHPGMLYGCLACEAECFCDGNGAWQCVACAIEEEAG